MADFQRRKEIDVIHLSYNRPQAEKGRNYDGKLLMMFVLTGAATARTHLGKATFF